MSLGPGAAAGIGGSGTDFRPSGGVAPVKALKTLPDVYRMSTECPPNAYPMSTECRPMPTDADRCRPLIFGKSWKNRPVRRIWALGGPQRAPG